jgi:hypothetical protein
MNLRILDHLAQNASRNKAGPSLTISSNFNRWSGRLLSLVRDCRRKHCPDAIVGEPTDVINYLKLSFPALPWVSALLLT